MKFSDIDELSWPELQIYLDTCLIPVSGLTGEETPWEATEKVALTGQWLAPIEEAFRGRTVTMPAFHYDCYSLEGQNQLDRLCKHLRANGFRYIVAVCGQPLALSAQLSADLIFQPSIKDEDPDPELMRKSVTELWRQSSKSQK
jgi:23S rRNA (pseudouridine1915-N3)-methyltransferase